MITVMLWCLTLIRMGDLCSYASPLSYRVVVAYYRYLSFNPRGTNYIVDGHHHFVLRYLTLKDIGIYFAYVIEGCHSSLRLLKLDTSSSYIRAHFEHQNLLPNKNGSSLHEGSDSCVTLIGPIFMLSHT